MTTYAAYFFDLGGTLVAIEDDEIARDPTGRVVLRPGVSRVLPALADMPVFVVTNQSGVALGTLSADQAHNFIAQVNDLAGGVITDYRICMHARTAECSCRKPQPGMILDLAAAHAIDLSRALMVGDTGGDKHCAESAGIGSFQWASEFFG